MLPFWHAVNTKSWLQDTSAYHSVYDWPKLDLSLQRLEFRHLMTCIFIVNFHLYTHDSPSDPDTQQCNDLPKINCMCGRTCCTYVKNDLFCVAQNWERTQIEVSSAYVTCAEMHFCISYLFSTSEERMRGCGCGCSGSKSFRPVLGLWDGVRKPEHWSSETLLKLNRL